ncbi:MAG TPA: hypothetical protein VNO70_19705 [Blastocatellia bacterium]|nr:hypothetical protein [Blastocatellia bacterium]
MGLERILVAFLVITSSLFTCLAAHQVKDQQKRSAEPQQQQKSTKAAKAQPARPEEIVLLINNIRSAPPEFAADLLIRVAESDKVADPAWKRELIEEAFRLAQAVQQPVKRVALPASPTDTRAGYLASAFELKMDALSLQSRAVSAMLSVDKRKARELFSEIPKLQLQPLTCEDALIYEVSEFYGTLRKVVETAFTQRELRNNEHVWLVESYISQMVSPVEVAPTLEVIASIKVSRSQREALIGAFCKQLSNLSGDDRSFTSSLHHVDQGMKNFITQCLQQGISVDELLRAYRTYLVRHFKAARCADNAAFFPKRIEQATISDFNKLRLHSSKNVPEISADDIKPLQVQGTVNNHMHWQSPKASALLMKVKKLRFGSGKTPLTTAERDSFKWQDEVSDFLKDLADWEKEDEQSEEDYFHQKCMLFRTLIQMIPQKATREDVIKDFVGFLNEFDLDRGSRIEWFWQARFLLKDSPYFDGPSGSAPSYVVKRSDMMPIVETTKNPILYLYTQAEKLLSDGVRKE